ncbi:hypothetical protein BKA93DRAFT_782449 [Sparassis latifolia]
MVALSVRLTACDAPGIGRSKGVVVNRGAKLQSDLDFCESHQNAGRNLHRRIGRGRPGLAQSQYRQSWCGLNIRRHESKYHPHTKTCLLRKVVVAVVEMPAVAAAKQVTGSRHLLNYLFPSLPTPFQMEGRDQLQPPYAVFSRELISPCTFCDMSPGRDITQGLWRYSCTFRTRAR